MDKQKKYPDIIIDVGFWFYVALLLLTVPFRWIFAIGISVAVHEMGHILALSTMKIPILKIDINALRIQIHTTPTHSAQELFCAAAGPAVGASLIFFAEWMPAVAVCAAFHSMVNLLPVYPTDGGRILYSLLRLCMPESVALKITETVRKLVVLFLIGVGIICVIAMQKRK